MDDILASRLQRGHSSSSAPAPVALPPPPPAQQQQRTGGTPPPRLGAAPTAPGGPSLQRVAKVYASTAEAIAHFKPTPREVISGIAPHVFDERKRRRGQHRVAAKPYWYAPGGQKRCWSLVGSNVPGGVGGEVRTASMMCAGMSMVAMLSECRVASVVVVKDYCY